MDMSNLFSIASVNRWKKVSDAEKFKRMSKASRDRWSKISKGERRKIALRLVKARLEKAKNKKS